MNSETVSREQVEMAVGNWKVRFREANHTPEEIVFIIAEYYEDLVDEKVSRKEFDHATKVVRRRCKFFPTVADILEAVKEYRTNPPKQNHPQLEEPELTPEQIEKNQKRFAILEKQIAGDLSMGEALKEQEGVSG